MQNKINRSDNLNAALGFSRRLKLCCSAGLGQNNAAMSTGTGVASLQTALGIHSFGRQRLCPSTLSFALDKTPWWIKLNVWYHTYSCNTSCRSMHATFTDCNQCTDRREITHLNKPCYAFYKAEHHLIDARILRISTRRHLWCSLGSTLPVWVTSIELLHEQSHKSTTKVWMHLALAS